LHAHKYNDSETFSNNVRIELTELDSEFSTTTTTTTREFNTSSSEDYISTADCNSDYSTDNSKTPSSIIDFSNPSE
jgi:hypothetical protein